MGYQEMTADEIMNVIQSLEHESNQLHQQRQELRQQMLNIQQEIEIAQEWWEAKRTPGDPTLTQVIG